MQCKKSSPYISLGISVLLLAGAFAAPAIGSLSAEMVRTLLVIFCAIVLWVKKPIPLAVSSLVLLVLLPMTGLVKNLNEAFSGYSNATNFFVLASFGLAIAVKKTTISNRLLKCFLSITHGRTKYVVLAYMLMVYVLSTVMSDIPAVVIGIAFAQQLLESTEEEARPALGRVLILSLPFASIIGGMVTPAGSSVNVMALNLLSANTGIEVGFLQWSAFTFPISVILLAAAWFILTHLFKADDLPEEQVNAFISNMSLRQTSSLKHEGYAIAVIVAMIAAWIAGSWISALNTTTVAVFGLLLLILPGIGAFNWKEFCAGVSWDIFLMGGATIQLGSLARSSGLVQLLADVLQANFAGLPPSVVIILLGVVVTLILVLMPVGPATVSMLVMPVFALSEAIGVNSVMMVIALGMFASNCSILPLNAVMLLSFAPGYWKIPDLMKTGILVTAVWLLLTALWFPVAAGLFL